MAVISPVDGFLQQERGRVAAAFLAGPPAQTAPVHEEGLELVPAVIQVECWQETDGSWAAHVPVLGVTAVADTEADLFAETYDAVDQFWALLNERYSTLSPELRALLELRQQPLSFRPRQ